MTVRSRRRRDREVNRIEVKRLIQRAVADPRHSFSIGSLGAVAEFFRDRDEPLRVDDIDRLTLATPRGAIRLQVPGSTLPLAYELLSRRRNHWQQGIVCCVPSTDSPQRSGSTLREVGPDADAVCSEHRNATLFELGLDTRNCEFFIRTDDDQLRAFLRGYCGQSILEHGNPVFAEIIRRSPHRIASSNFGRIEVYQAIGLEKTPVGPHTHVLPKLLSGKRSHPGTIPVPKGHLPGLSIYPPHPLQDALGNLRTFDEDDHLAFERLLARWGAPEYRESKQSVRRSIERCEEPLGFSAPKSRLSRTGIRIAVRQLTAAGNATPLVERWRQTYDRPRA